MSGGACPRCQKALPENVLRDLTRGTSCPFCAAPLKRSPRRALDVPLAADEGYASFELDKPIRVSNTPPPAPKAKLAAAPASKPAAVTPLKPAITAAAMPKSLRATMVGAAIAPSDLPFVGAQTAAAVAISPPVTAPPVRGPAPPLPAAKPAAAPAKVSPMASTMLATPATQPANRLPLPGSVPAPAANGAGTVKPFVPMTESQPTRVSPPSPSSAPSSGIVSPLVSAMDSEPTHVAAPREPAPIAPVLGGNDSEPIASVTLAPDLAPNATPPLGVPTMLQPVQPRRGLALIGVGMGLAIVALIFGGMKLLGGSKKSAPTALARVAAPAPAAAPVVEAVTAPAAPAPAAKAPEARPPKAKSREAKAPAPAVAAKPPVEPKPAAEKRSKRHATHRAKAPHRQAARGHKVAMTSSTAKRSAPPAPAERADPRPAYERGNALLLAGDGKGAISAYREAVKSSPSDPIGFRGLGLAYEQQGETSAAIRALRRYLKLAPHAADHDLIAKRVDRLAARAKQK